MYFKYIILQKRSSEFVFWNWSSNNIVSGVPSTNYGKK